MYIINTIPHGKCFVRYLRTRCSCIRNLTRSLRSLSFDFWYINNSCVNTVRQHFPWSILYVLISNRIYLFIYLFIFLLRLCVRLYISHFFYPCVFESGAPLEKESVQSAVHCVLQRSFETEKKVVCFCTEYFPIRLIRDKGKFVTLKLLSGQKTD